MRRCLLAALAVLFPSLAWAADVPSLPAATTLSGATIYIANGGAQDNSSGFSTGIFCISGGNIILCNGGITAAMLASTTGSGSTVVLSAGPTISGSPTFSGTPIMTGLSAGTIVTNKFIGLDSGNNMVLGAGGGLTNALTHGHVYVGNGSDVATDTSLTGDLGCGTSTGGFSTCVVTGFQGRAFASTAPSNGQVITWDQAGNTWKPGAGGSVTGTGTANLVAKWTGSSAVGNSTIGDAGSGVTIGSPTGGAQGAGTLNASHLYKDGVEVNPGGGGGSGTVNSGTTPQAAYYAVSTNAVSGASGVTYPSANSIAVNSPSGSTNAGEVNAQAGYKVNGTAIGAVLAATTGNVAVANWNAGATFVATTASQTLTLLVSSGYSTSGGINVIAATQDVTLALANGADAFACATCAGTPGASITIGKGTQVVVVTDGAGSFRLNAPGSPMTLSDAGQVLTGGVHPTAFSNGTASSGTKTIDCGNGPIQTLTNGGAFTFAMSANDGECTVRITNNGSASTITFSGFSQGSNNGDAFTTANGAKFDVVLTRIGGNPHYLVTALQ